MASILNSKYIRVYILAEHPSSLVGKSKLERCPPDGKCYGVHTEVAHKAFQQLMVK
jgi:hypothetical protein